MSTSSTSTHSCNFFVYVRMHSRNEQNFISETRSQREKQKPETRSHSTRESVSAKTIATESLTLGLVCGFWRPYPSLSLAHVLIYRLHLVLLLLLLLSLFDTQSYIVHTKLNVQSRFNHNNFAHHVRVSIRVSKQDSKTKLWQMRDRKERDTWEFEKIHG